MSKEIISLVSICIPVVNREELVLEAIRSVQSQTIKDIEIVIIDNASTDLTYEKVYEEVKKDKRINLYRNSENIGALKNFHKAINLAKSPSIVLLGSDDWIEPDFLETRLNGFKNNPEVSIVSGPMKIFEETKAGKNLVAKYKYKASILSFDFVCKNVFKKYCKFFLTYNTGALFSWGSGENYRLMHNSKENINIPSRVEFFSEHIVSCFSFAVII